MLKHTVYIIAMAGVLAAAPASADTVSDFEDILSWVGQGDNESALVLDWNGGPTPRSLVWGYRWSAGDAPTAADMLTDIVAADGRLNGRVQDFGGGLGMAVYGLGYDLNGDGTLPTVREETVGADTAGDHWADGWLSAGYWSQWFDDGAGWVSGMGVSNRDLVDGGWDGLSFGPGFNVEAPSPGEAATPEPASLGLLALGLGAVLARRRKG